MNAYLRPVSLITLVTALLLVPGITSAQTEQFRARLSPMPKSLGAIQDITGGGEVLLTLDGNVLTAEGTFSGMSSAATGVHLHNGPPAVPGPVIHTLSIDASPAGAVSGSVELTEAQLQALRDGALYIQVHSSNNPPGELRGWIFPRS